MGICLLALVCGAACALFLAGLALAWTLFCDHPALRFALPVLGAATALGYRRWGGLSDQGNNLLIEEIRFPSRPIPWTMAPLVLIGTLLTHIGGGSAGREGTAVQMGGAFSDAIHRGLHLPPRLRPLFLRCGMAAGFSALFGTPLAGTVFALEVPVQGELAFSALLPCLLCGFLAHATALLCGAHHSPTWEISLPHPSLRLLIWLGLAAAVFGLAARLYVACAHGFSASLRRRIPDPVQRALVGGGVLASIFSLPGMLRFASLGLPLIAASPRAPQPWTDAPGKLLLTALTLGFGFKGGEVTPLFSVGASLGSSLSAAMPLSTPLLAALGLCAVFGACAKVPLCATLLAIELFGIRTAPWALPVCLFATFVSGRLGIYASQGRRTPGGSP